MFTFFIVKTAGHNRSRITPEQYYMQRMVGFGFGMSSRLSSSVGSGGPNLSRYEPLTVRISDIGYFFTGAFIPLINVSGISRTPGGSDRFPDDFLPMDVGTIHKDALRPPGSFQGPPRAPHPEPLAHRTPPEIETFMTTRYYSHPEDVEDVGRCKQYIIHHYNSWAKWDVLRSRELDPEDLVFVTGRDMTYEYSTPPHSQNTINMAKDSVDEPSRCMFIRGYRMFRRGKTMKLSSPNQEFLLARSICHAVCFDFRRRLQHDEDGNEVALITSQMRYLQDHQPLYATSEKWEDPLVHIARYIFKKSKAGRALVHDSDLAKLFNMYRRRGGEINGNIPAIVCELRPKVQVEGGVGSIILDSLNKTRSKFMLHEKGSRL